MPYVTWQYYANQFCGTPVPESDFDRLAALASDVVDAIIRRPIPENVDRDKLARATAYQLEMLQRQGGTEAVTGFAAGQQSVTEKLDDYAITQSQTGSAAQYQQTVNGIPVSPLTVSLLRSMGLTCRWLYAGRGERG